MCGCTLIAMQDGYSADAPKRLKPYGEWESTMPERGGRVAGRGFDLTPFPLSLFERLVIRAFGHEIHHHGTELG